MKKGTFEVVRDSDGVVVETKTLQDDAIDLAAIREADEGTAFRVQPSGDAGHIDLTVRISAEHWRSLRECMQDGTSARVILERALDAYVVAATGDEQAPWETNPDAARERQATGGNGVIPPELLERLH